MVAYHVLMEITILNARRLKLLCILYKYDVRCSGKQKTQGHAFIKEHNMTQHITIPDHDIFIHLQVLWFRISTRVQFEIDTYDAMYAGIYRVLEIS
uniref:Uncharacterized protein n=1 Tax=Glossina brevipalpis TaxID=37001 RepID=A0A1A9W6G5_9MUSC